MVMDSITEEQGRELQEVILLFKETTTSPLSKFVLQTPKHKMKVTEDLSTREKD
jgi:hypothetical protein